MLTELQSVVGPLRRPSCGDVAAYSAVCCISDVGLVMGNCKADSAAVEVAVDSGKDERGRREEAELAEKSQKKGKPQRRRADLGVLDLGRVAAVEKMCSASVLACPVFIWKE